MRYVRDHGGKKLSNSGAVAKLLDCILNFDSRGAADWARKAVDEGRDPTETLNLLIDTIRRVGDSFGRGEIFLPELMGAAQAMQSALPILEAEITKSGKQQQTEGTLVIGTVKGDIHDIGKTIVGIFFMTAGFKVIDLGVDVPAQRFVEAVREHNPDILGMSALLTTTALGQAKVMQALREAGLRDRVKVIVGGAAVTPELAKNVGADGYGATAVEGLQIAEKLLGKN
jgi:5-methyltetrahydrofolate--homocysteine methyltransferase